MKKLYFSIALKVFFLWGLACSDAVLAKDNVHLYGALSAEPCMVSPEGGGINVEFGTIVDRYLYANTRTHGVPFNIELTDCDVSVKNTVKIKIIGTENSELKGMLSLDDSSQASGFAIGFESSSGKKMPLNNYSDAFQLNKGNNYITLKSFLIVEPQSKKNADISRGQFTATATLDFFYE